MLIAKICSSLSSESSSAERSNQQKAEFIEVVFFSIFMKKIFDANSLKFLIFEIFRKYKIRSTSRENWEETS